MKKVAGEPRSVSKLEPGSGGKGRREGGGEGRREGEGESGRDQGRGGEVYWSLNRHCGDVVEALSLFSLYHFRKLNADSQLDVLSPSQRMARCVEL